MKKIGLIGGVGPESTIAYYRLLIKRYQQALGTNDFPSLLINSINMTRMVSLLPIEKHNDFVDFLYDEVKVLKDAGMDYVAITSNTPHIVFNELQQRCEVPLISIVQETCKIIRSQACKKVILLGTKSTMTGGFYNLEGMKYDVEIISPHLEQQDYIHDKYFNELVMNIIKEETKNELIKIVNELINESNSEGIILGGTELPLILSQDDFSDIQVFDSASIHVDSIIHRLIGE